MNTAEIANPLDITQSASPQGPVVPAVIGTTNLAAGATTSVAGPDVLDYGLTAQELNELTVNASFVNCEGGAEGAMG